MQEGNLMQLSFSRWWCAEYVDGDQHGEILANIALLPYFVILHVASRCYCRRTVHDLVIFAGLVSNEALAKILKHLLQQPRPADRCAMLGTCDSFGMPSSHTQCMFFAATLHAILLSRHVRKCTWPSVIMSLFELAAATLGALAVAYSRVYLKYHSVDQVFIGSIVGTAFAIVWGMLLRALAPYYAAFSSSTLGCFFHFKDSWGVPEPLIVEKQAMKSVAMNKKKHAK